MEVPKMKKFLLLIPILLLSACATANIATKSIDGKVIECTGSYISILKDTDILSLSACGSKGNSAGSKTNTVLAQELFKLLLAAP